MKCGQCGGKLGRVHRTFLERFNYMAIYECHKCKRQEFVPRRFRYHLGPSCRCPKCGTYRVVRLKHPDKIDGKLTTGRPGGGQGAVGAAEELGCVPGTHRCLAGAAAGGRMG